AKLTSSNNESVTPLQADSTTARRSWGCDSTIAATRSKHCASATLEPPNFCTTQARGSEELIDGYCWREKPQDFTGRPPFPQAKYRGRTLPHDAGRSPPMARSMGVCHPRHS